MISGFSIDYQQINQFQYLIKVVTPEKNTFIGGIQAPGLLMNQEIAWQIWEQNRKNFILELDLKEVKNDIVKS